MSVPPDFGGFLAAWKDDGHCFIVRYGRGKLQDGMRLSPLNLLQLRKTLDEMIVEGEQQGHITEEHRRQSGQLPTSRGVENIMRRRDVDEIAGDQ